MDLEIVRDIRNRIEEEREKVKALRLTMSLPTARLDGLPRSHSLESRVEGLAVHLVDAEQKVERLEAECDKASASLFDEIQRRVRTPVHVAMLVMRYISCLSFRTIARKSDYSLRQVFRLVKRAEEEFYHSWQHDSGTSAENEFSSFAAT